MPFVRPRFAAMVSLVRNIAYSVRRFQLSANTALQLQPKTEGEAQSARGGRPASGHYPARPSVRTVACVAWRTVIGRFFEGC